MVSCLPHSIIDNCRLLKLSSLLFIHSILFFSFDKKWNVKLEQIFRQLLSTAMYTLGYRIVKALEYLKSSLMSFTVTKYFKVYTKLETLLPVTQNVSSATAKYYVYWLWQE